MPRRGAAGADEGGGGEPGGGEEPRQRHGRGERGTGRGDDRERPAAAEQRALRERGRAAVAGRGVRGRGRRRARVQHERLDLVPRVRRADPPARAGGVAVAGARRHRAGDLREAIGGRRRERREVRVDVADAGLERPVVGGRVQVPVLADEAVVVGVALRVARRDADDVPVRGDLARVGGIEPQRAAAHLPHGHAGGRAREVDEAVDARRVPPLAEERARADQRARRAGGERGGGERDPAPRAPVAGAAQLGEPVGAGGHGRPAARGPLLVSGRQRGEQRLRVGGRAAQPAPGDEQRAQHRGAAVVGERADRRARRPRVRVEHAAQLAVRPRPGELRVAQHERAEVGAARLRLRAEQLDERERLRRRSGQQPVDVRRPAADPRARELEAEVAQRGGHRLAALGRRGRGVAVQAAQHPVLEQHDPVVEVGRAAVRLAARRAGRQRQAGRAEEAHAGGGERGVAALEVGPWHLRGVVAVVRPHAMAQPRHDPLPEVERPGVAHVEQRRDQLAEARLVLVEPALLAGQRLGQPGELLVGREVPVADDGGRRHLEVDRPEQHGVQLGLVGGQLVGRRRGEPDHVHVAAELLEHRAHDVAPQGGEVVALVEHHGAHAGGAQRVHAPARARREQRGEPSAARARDLALQRGRDARELARTARRGGARPCGRLGGDRRGLLRGGGGALRRPARHRGVAQRGAGVVEPRERLVGQAGDRRARRVGDRPGRRAERDAGARPLRLDRRVGGEHERGDADPAQHLEAEQRLARAGRGDDVRVPPSGGAVGLEGGERELLVVAPRAREAQGGRERRGLGHARDARACSRPPRRGRRPCCAPSARARHRPGARGCGRRRRAARRPRGGGCRRRAPSRGCTAPSPGR